MKTGFNTKNRILPLKVFMGGVLIYLLAVLPFLIYRKGLFFYYGDYNVQQVPFLIFAHRAVRSGHLFWNPLVDLGGNMTGTFAFYLWGSPFFWLTIPFPEAWLPYMMPFIMALKFGLASAAAFLWIRTQTRSDTAAVLGAYLYAFSGFQACNIVFQHFHDVTAFFPFYLLAFDRFVTGSRKVCGAGALAPGNSKGFGAGALASGNRKSFGAGALASGSSKGFGAGALALGSSKGFGAGTFAPGEGEACGSQSGTVRSSGFSAQISVPGAADLLGFTLMTALMAIINYYFFFGQVVFLVLYYIVRWGIRRFKGSGLKAAAAEILRILGAGAAGLLLASFFLVQSIGGILGNSRVSNVVNGYDLIMYPDASTPLAILKSFFMVPDLIARGTLFTNDNIRNGSLAFYLPCFAMAGVFAFWILRRKSWKKTLLTLLAVMAFVPVLNAAFSAFNSNFYTRWFYMLILLCACMTAEVLEEEDSSAFTRGTLLSLACTALMLLFCFLPVKSGNGWSFTSVCDNRALLDKEIEGTVMGAALLLVILFIKRRFGKIFSDPAERVSAPEDSGNSSAAVGTETCSAEEIDNASAVTAEVCSAEEIDNASAAAADAGSAEESIAAPAASEEACSAEEIDNASAAAAEEARNTETANTNAKRTAFRQFAGILNPGTACLLLTIICCIISTYLVLDNGKSLISYSGFEKWKIQMLTQRPLLAPAAMEEEDDPTAATEAEGTKPEGTGLYGIEEEEATGPVPGVDAPFSRVETDGTSTNYEMVWGYPTMHCFESTVHPSIFTWYRGIGMIRTVESTLPFERIGARAVMSVRYYIENTLVKPDNSYTDQGGIDGYSILNDRRGYNVYETENYIPMGFSFDSYMTEENYDYLNNGKVSDRVLVKDIILSGEMAAKYGHLLAEDTKVYEEEMSYEEFTEHCNDRAASACTEFAFDKNGFHATAQMKKDNLLLFSIPFDRGFSATVDGEPAEVECADFGLTAIFVPEGTHEIRVTYLPVGLKPAAAVSVLTAALLLVLGITLHRRKQKML